LKSDIAFRDQGILPTFTIFDCFEYFSDLLDVYVQCILLFHQVFPFFLQERTQNREFEEWTDSINSKFGDITESYLITPIQRPVRYQPLIQELIRTTGEKSTESNTFEQILQNVIYQIKRIDSKIEVSEGAQQKAEISQKLPDFDVNKIGRQLLFQGKATMHSTKHTGERYLILFSDCLIVCECTYLSSLKVEKTFQVNEFKIQSFDSPGHSKFAIDIFSPAKSFQCNLEDKNCKTKILEGFSRMIINNNSPE
jgi:hypothetical protein